MNAEIVQRLEASFSSTDESLQVVNENKAQADIFLELKSFRAEFAEFLETIGVPDFTDDGTAIRETRQIVGELLERVKALPKSPSPGAQAGALPEDVIKAIIDTREMVSELHQAIKAPPPAPYPFARKKKA